MLTPEEKSAINARNASGSRGPLRPQHRQAISEGVRAAGKRRPHWTDALKPQEHADYLTLTRIGGFTRAEALRSIGRDDLI
jgi:hypothetical protein